MIITFPQTPRVVITCARITETRCHTSEGTAVVRHDPPELRFFIDLEEGDGRCGVWDGTSYADALDAARDWLAEGIEVRDRTSEYRGRA